MKKICEFCLVFIIGYCGNLQAVDSSAKMKEMSAQKNIDRSVLFQQHVYELKRNSKIQEVREKIPENQADRHQILKSGSLELIDNTIFFRYGYDNNWVYMGRIKNIGTVTYSFVKINVELRNSADVIVGTDFTYIYGTNLTMTATDWETDTCLRPGETGFFGFYVDTPSTTDAIYYNIEADSFLSATPDAKLVMWQGPWAHEDYDGYVDLSGVVKNTGVADLKFGTVACAVNAEDGEMLDAFFTFIDGEYIDGSESGLRVGHTADFDLSLLFGDYSDYSYSECRFGWDDYGANQPPPGTGDCVQDLEGGVVCLRDGRFAITGTWTDFSNPSNTRPLVWTPIEDINATAGFQNNPTGIQVVMRVADGCSLTGTWWIWLGGFTDAGWYITVHDTITGIVRTFSRDRSAGDFPTTERDSETFSCN